MNQREKCDLDITADVCPITFVKTKLMLEKMPVGAIATVRLKGVEPLENVPRSILAHGHDVISLTPEVAGEVVSEIAEGYPMVDPLMVEEIVKKHLVSIMEELKAAYTEMGKMKDKMAAFASQMETMTDIVEKVAELPSESPKPTASAIVEQRKAAATQNFNALAEAIQNLKKSK